MRIKNIFYINLHVFKIIFSCILTIKNTCSQYISITYSFQFVLIAQVASKELYNFDSLSNLIPAMRTNYSRNFYHRTRTTKIDKFLFEIVFHGWTWIEKSHVHKTPHKTKRFIAKNKITRVQFIEKIGTRGRYDRSIGR